MIRDRDSFLSRSTVLLVLSLITFLCYFFRIKGYGLYEDDYLFIGSFIGDSGSEIYQNTIKCLSTMPQGRPLAFAFPAIVTYIGVSLTDDLTIVYIIGAMFCLANSFLVYSILRKWISLQSAFIGALIFLLSPADTTKILLTHNLILQPSLFCALLGIIFFMRRKFLYLIPAYILGAMTLLFYESGILVFLFAPFFVTENKNSFFKRLIIHAGIIGMIILVFSLLRASFGESRVSDLISGSKFELFLKIITGPFIGIGGSLAAMIYGTLKGIQKAIKIEIVPVILSGVVLVYWLIKSVARTETETGNVIVRTPLYITAIFRKLFFVPVSVKKLFNGISFVISAPAYIACVGALMIPAAYLLAFTHYPPVTLSSRLTSVHLPATVAWAVFTGGLLEFFLKSQCTRSFKSIVISLTGVILMLWSSYAIYLQDGFATVWYGQKQFWKEVRTLTPDLNKNSTVVFEKRIREYSRTWCADKNIIGGADWALPIAFRMYVGNHSGASEIIVRKSITELIWQKQNGTLRYFHSGTDSWGKWSDLDTTTMIFFTMNAEGDLQRIKSMSVFDYTYPVQLKKSDNITTAILDHELPEKIISEYYFVNGDMREFRSANVSRNDYVKVNFKKIDDTEKSSVEPDGILRKFMDTGKFGLK